jgi:predicted Rossmann-fold nucleotide-binding protein
MSPAAHPVLGVFASDRGPGDAERSSIMSQTGTYLAHRGAKLVCLAEGETLPIPLVTSARAAGGEVTIIADESFRGVPALRNVPVERLPTREARLKRMAQLSSVYVVLPGSLASASSLYLTWVRGGGGPAKKPVVFYDRNNAFRVMRGFAADVLANGVRHHDHYVQFADSIEDMWNKIGWLVDQKATAL